MTADAEPRIRVKTDRWNSAMKPAFFDLLERLRHGAIATQDYMRELMHLLEGEHLAHALRQEGDEAMRIDGQLELLRRHVDDCRHTVLLYRVDENEVHPPHHHFNVISAQVVLRGRVQLREYERIRRDGDGRLVMKLARDCELRPGGVFNAGEWHRNVHWFTAVGGPALIFNINARGYEKATFDSEDQGRFGRRYIDLSSIGEDGTATCEELDEESAETRFQGKPLTDFPLPAGLAGTGEGPSISI